MDLIITLAALRDTQHGAFFNDALSAGEIEGDSLRISKESFDELNQKHFKRTGWGNIVHALAQPVARAADKLLGTNFQNCNECAERRLLLNRVRK